MGKMSHGGDIYRNRDVIDFSSNCNPFGPPKGVVNAIRNAASEIGHYPDTMCQEIKERLSSKLRISEEYLFFGNGAAEVIFALASAIKPKKVLIPAPTFSEYEDALSDTVEVEHYLMSESLTIESDILDSITEDIDAVFICNPNNPTGILTENSLIIDILNKCESVGARLVLDECFLDFVQQEQSLLDQTRSHPSLVILKAFTKLYAMAGVRLGYCITSDVNLIKSLEESVQPWNVSSLAQAAGIAALSEDEYVSESLRVINEEKHWLEKELSNLVELWPSQGNYMFFKSSPELYDELMDKGIMIRNCRNYKGLDDGYYRAAVRLHEDNLKLVKAIKEILWQKQ